VRRAHRRRGFAQGRRRFQDVSADIDVLTHDRHLAGRQRPRLHQQRVGHRGFADVVKARGDHEHRLQPPVHVELARHRLR
jgi:hypothetical protein